MEERATAAAPTVVITGVSTGIGYGTAKVLTAHGYRVFGSVRRKADADRLSIELGAAFTPLLFDVTDAATVMKGAEATREALNGRKLDALVNNAGIAVPGPLLEMPVSDLRRQLEVNLVSILTVTQAFFPLLRTRAERTGLPSRIINISSIAGRLALPFLGPYAASKHGVEGLSDSLRRECMLYGIDVIVIDPGSVATAIWDKADAIDFTAYARSPWLASMTRLKDTMVSSGCRGSPPEKVGGVVLEALTARRPRLRYTVTSGNPMVRLVQRLMTKRMFDRVLGRTLGLLSGRV
jgi:NAD(P)-dependent dehydrogenase (short-subunit alcohol dehydrogenase family)